ncbi:MAG: hypothetical protein WCG44_04920, partial [bacterium]
RDPWWQAMGSGIYSGGAITSKLPTSYDLIIADPLGSGIGALLQPSSSSNNLGSGDISTSNLKASTTYGGKVMDYKYFSANMGVIKGGSSATTSNWISDAINYEAIKDITPPKDFYYIAPHTAGSTITTASSWSVPAGEKYVVFVNGNFNIKHDITVDKGGFLAFIVNGTITIDPVVTKLQGIYVSNGFTAEKTNISPDIALNVEGSVVSWGSVSLLRDLKGNNGSNPAERFTYRPDFLINMPDKMKNFITQWAEVAPGTYSQ